MTAATDTDRNRATVTYNTTVLGLASGEADTAPEQHEEQREQSFLSACVNVRVCACVCRPQTGSAPEPRAGEHYFGHATTDCLPRLPGLDARP